MKNATSSAKKILFLALFVSGCATPKPVLELASQGVAITAKSEVELANFVERSERLHALRLAAVNRLAVGDIEASAKVEFEDYTLQRAGMQTGLDSVKLIRELSDLRAQVRENALRLQVKLEKKLADQEDAPKVPKKEIAELRNALVQLSEELSTQDWLMFAFAYAQQVREGQEKSKDLANQAEAKAKSADTSATTDK